VNDAHCMLLGAVNKIAINFNDIVLLDAEVV